MLFMRPHVQVFPFPRGIYGFIRDQKTTVAMRKLCIVRCNSLSKMQKGKRSKWFSTRRSGGEEEEADKRNVHIKKISELNGTIRHARPPSGMRQWKISGAPRERRQKEKNALQNRGGRQGKHCTTVLSMATNVEMSFSLHSHANHRTDCKSTGC